MDFQAIDPARNTLYLAYPGADEILVIDLKRNVVTGAIRALRRVHGVLAIPSLRRLYASASGTDEVAMIDETSQKISSRAAGGAYPDSIAYDPKDAKLFVSDAHGTSVTVIAGNTNRRVDTINIGEDPGNTQYDPVKGLVYSVVGGSSELVAIDPSKDTVIARYALPGCDHGHGLWLDSEHRLAFIACEQNARLIVLDMATLKELSAYRVGEEPDILAFDPGLGRLYVAAESGTLAVFQEKGRSLQPLGVGCLADGAHTVAVDPKTHRVYFALRDVGGRAVIRVMEPNDSGQS